MERDTTHLSQYIRALRNEIVKSTQKECQFCFGTVKIKKENSPSK